MLGLTEKPIYGTLWSIFTPTSISSTRLKLQSFALRFLLGVMHLVMRIGRGTLGMLQGIGHLLLPLAKRMVVRLVILTQTFSKRLPEQFSFRSPSWKKVALQTGAVVLLLVISRGTLLASDQTTPNGLIDDSTPASPTTVSNAPSTEVASATTDLEQLFVNDTATSENVSTQDDGYMGPEDTTPAPEAKPARTSVIHYAVKDGDTISSIAQEFEISSSTVLWANGLTATSVIRPGQDLMILPVSGVTYTVRENDTLQKIADSTHSDVDAIRSLNGVTDTSLIAGTHLIIPNGRPVSSSAIALRKPTKLSPREIASAPVRSMEDTNVADLDAKGISGLIWPTTLRHINQFFGVRHTGVDIQGHLGNPIYAVEDGIVAIAGWNHGGYGQQVIVDHENGMLTRYAHMTKILVSPGESVSKGQVIGLVGSTGHSTGPHLHFEIVIHGIRMNPLKYL